MSAYLLNLITPSTAQAANDLHQQDAAALDRLATACRKAAKRKAGALVDAADVAQVAALVAAPLVLAGRAEDDAARIATHRATVAALRDSGHNETADRLDQAGEDATAEGTPLARLAAPVEVRADRGTAFTDRDRLALAVESIDPEHVTTLRTVLAAPAQERGPGAGGFAAAALSAAAGKVHSGRQKQAAAAALADAVAALAGAYRSTLTALDWTRQRAAWTEDAAALAAAQIEDAASSGPVRRDSLSRGDSRTSGPAGPVAVLVAGFPIDPTTGALLALAERARPTLPPFQPARGQAKQEAGFQAPETGTTVSARPIPGVGRDPRTGAAYAQAGPAGTLSGTGTAQRPSAPRKRRRDGAIGGSMTRA